MDPAPPIRVNRAPVLTLWAAVVAERMGYSPDIALTLGRFVAGSSARAKARRLGISDEKQEAEERHARAAELKPRRQTVHLLGRPVSTQSSGSRVACPEPPDATLLGHSGRRPNGRCWPKAEWPVWSVQRRKQTFTVENFPRQIANNIRAGLPRVGLCVPWCHQLGGGFQ
jgi:hypothetical protein